MPTVKKISHVAVVVSDIDASLSFWRDALGIKLSGIKNVPSEGAKIAFLPVGEGEIELVQPIESGLGLFRFLEKRGPGMHHICLEVDDIQGMMDRLKEKGVRLINDTPQVEPGGKKYAFIHPKSAQGVLVELYEIIS
jgi:methylmalonyl-CoA/ethylmalonyl-CoA epimerase